MNNSLSYRIVIFVFLTVAISLIYSNTFYASWHLDDQPNIVNNYYLHLDSLHPEKLINTFYTDPHDPEQLGRRLYRPVACLTFALNWYVGQDNVVGYHIVNTVIHILTAFYLFLFIRSLFNTPNLKKKCPENPVFIAFLASLLWAVNPIQTQAVTYIVQRMAQLAAFFYIIGLYAYLKARMTTGTYRRLVWLLSCIVVYVLGVYSKPNATMMPIAIALIEIAFFQDISDKKIKKKIFLATAILSVLVLFFSIVFFLRGDPFSFLNLYQARTFTLSERLLTQPRVILFYLSQIFFPVPDRLSIAHDVVISSSLFEPWTTLPSILIICLIIVFSISQIRKRPILSFSILFFFLNHIIESSIIALEIIFEHRNYLPSFFLFLPLSCLLNTFIVENKSKKKVCYALTVCFIMFLVSFFSVNTFLRNQVWKDDISLWIDAVSKAPNNARASNVLAIKLAWGDNSNHPKRYDMALQLFQDSLEKHLPRGDVKSEIYGNMALIYFHHKDNPQKAFTYFDKALKIAPGNLKIRRELVEALIIIRNFETARENVDILLEKNSENGRYLNLKGHILLWQGHYKEALSCFKKAYPLLIDKSSVLLNSAVALSLAGKYNNAEQLLREAIKHYPDEITYYFAMIENSTRASDKNKTCFYTKEMLKRFDRQQINVGLVNFTNNPKYAPMGDRPILSAMSNIK